MKNLGQKLVEKMTKKPVMSKEEKEIYRSLKARPGYIYIHEEGHKAYCLVEGRRGMLELTSTKSFLSMTEDEVNDFLQDALGQLIERGKA